jgi:NNP family nitrate/nitrite transporter-like MFS transporter
MREKPPPPVQPLLTPALLCASFAAASASNTILGLPAVMPFLLEAFHLSHGQGGFIVTALWIPHAITQAITGWAAEAIGVQRLLRWVLAALALLVAASLLAPNYATLLGLRALTGMGTGASFVLAILYAAARSDPAFHRRNQSFVGAMSYVCTSLAFASIPLVLGLAGWRAGYVPALACILGALALATLGPRLPRPTGMATARLTLRASVRVVWRGRIPVLALAHLCSFGVFVVVASWLTAYFVQGTGLSPTGSLYMGAVVLASGAVGRFAGGAVLGRAPDRLLVMAALAASGSALVGLALSPPFPVAPLLAFVILGCCSLTYGSIFALALGRRPPGEAGVAVSAVSFLAGLGGSTLPTLMGWLVDRTGTFAAGFALLAALSFLAILCLALAPPTPHAATWSPGNER